MALCSDFALYIANHPGYEDIKEVLKTKRLREVCGEENRFEDGMVVEEDEEKQSAEEIPASGLCCFQMNTFSDFEKEIAVIAYSTDFHPTFWIAVTYMAIGRENFARLRQIQRALEGSFKEKKCDLRLLEEVTVRKEQVLNCGVKLQRDIPVIDCKEEKEKEVLTEEAYQLWQEK